MPTRHRSSKVARRLGLLLTLLLLAAAGPYQASRAPDDGFRPTAYPHVQARQMPDQAGAGAGGQIYVKPGSRPVQLKPSAAVPTALRPAVGGGELVTIPPSMYPASRAEIGPDGKVRIGCEGEHEAGGDHHHGEEAAR